VTHAEETLQIVDEIGPLLAGHTPEVQGAVLADLLAMWLTGYCSVTKEATQRMRDEQLALHLEAVARLCR
jgi:hypothetical protein